jgi:hypothetical protein
MAIRVRQIKKAADDGQASLGEIGFSLKAFADPSQCSAAEEQF